MLLEVLLLGSWCSIVQAAVSNKPNFGVNSGIAWLNSTSVMVMGGLKAGLYYRNRLCLTQFQLNSLLIASRIFVGDIATNEAFILNLDQQFPLSHPRIYPAPALAQAVADPIVCSFPYQQGQRIAVRLFGGVAPLIAESSTVPALTPIRSRQEWNPDQNAWKEVDSWSLPDFAVLRGAGSSHISYYLRDGLVHDVYLFGGMNPNYNFCTDQLIKVTAHAEWSIVKRGSNGVWPEARCFSGMTRLNATHIVLSGGKQGDIVYSDWWIYSIDQQNWTRVHLSFICNFYLLFPHCVGPVGYF
jgi:hypothetical protein